MKDIFQSLVENPFYYMDLGTHWDGESETLPPTYGKELYQHWQKLFRVDEVGAEEWRTSTVQMMNRYLEPRTGPTTAPIHPVEAWDTTTGVRSWNIRQRYVNQLVRNMLDRSSLISPMLLDHDPKKELETEEPFRREGLLRQCYELACDFGVQLWVNSLSFRFEENINEIGPYTKRPASRQSLLRHKRWWAGGQHFSDTPVDYAKDNEAGRQAVVIFWPTIWCVWNGQDGKESLYSYGGRKGVEGVEHKEWIYVDDRDWVYEVLASGHVYIAGKGKVKPGDVSHK
ncbi:hypothetical protein N7493_006944 [Penicillium malachiteum]|uniref:Uncharacterized protein n=1 Tax=Penicillium malachiteum TaxID=1324776 RepID=A0AAD6HJN3_9EURO|nr:hypothetical protein N7493_006944 [Penicillium malachiteum]